MGVGINRWILVTVSLGICEGLIGTFFPLIFIEKGGNELTLGITIGVMSLLGSLQFLWGFLIDKFRLPKKMAISGMALNMVSMGMMAKSNDSETFGSGRMVNGFSNGLISNSEVYLRSAYFPTNKRGRVGSLFIGMNLIGLSIGVFISGLIYNIYGFGLSLEIHTLALVLFLLSIILFYISVPEYNEDLILDETLINEKTVQESQSQYSFKEKLRLIKRSSSLVIFSIGYLFFHFFVSLSGPFFILDLFSSWQFNQIQIAFLTTMNTILQALVIFGIMPVIDFINRKKLFSFGSILAIIPILGLSLSPSDVTFMSHFTFWIIIYIISSIGWGIVNSTLLTLLIDYVDPKARATFIGIFASIQALMTFFASILGGFLIEFVLSSRIKLFYISLVGRIISVIVIIISKAPPIPFADFYEQRRIFFTRIRSSIERGAVLVPIVNNLVRRKKIFEK